MAGCTAESGTCDTCQSYCANKPGWFLPGEAENAAAYLGMTLPEFFGAYLAVDWLAGTSAGESPVFLLSPAVAGIKTGAEFPADPRGTCVFFKAGRCRIHPVKPYECASVWCGGPRDAHRETALAWRGDQDQVRELLGREPRSVAFTLVDLLWGP